MSAGIYSLTPLNLALDGTLDSFVETYRSIYEVYLLIVREMPSIIANKAQMDSAAIPEIVPIVESLLFKRLRIFTTEISCVTLKAHHFKRFSFFNETKVSDFKWKQQYNLEWKDKGLSSLVDNRYLESGNEEFEFQETAITLEHFLKEVQRIVVRAVHEEIQKTKPNFTIFDARAAVETRISARMKQSREEFVIPRSDEYQPNVEPLFVYDRLNGTGCKQKKHTLTVKKYYALKNDGNHVLALPAHYCEDCEKYMIGSLSLSLLREYSGDFVARTCKLISETDNVWDLLGESKLHKLGYNVVDGKLSVAERQNILIAILEGKQMPFFEIVATIEQNIRFFDKNPRMQKAVVKWKNDLRFINTYVLGKEQ